MVCYIWWEHNKFFRRYGLQDAWTAFLNSVLLFVVVFYVYPLKFLATALLRPLVGLPFVPFGDGRMVMLIYSVGVLCIFALLALLYQHCVITPSGARTRPRGSRPAAIRQARASHLRIARNRLDCARACPAREPDVDTGSDLQSHGPAARMEWRAHPRRFEEASQPGQNSS